MSKSKIPRFPLETFAEENFKIPLMEVEHYPLNAQYFSVQNRENYPVKDYISPNRRDFYKIFHITSGTGVLTIGLHQYDLKPGDIAFLHPDELMSWQITSKETGGHFCLIHPNYFTQADHVLQTFRHYPLFQANRAVVSLHPEDSERVDSYFQHILKEYESEREDKKDAILLHLQMILLLAKRSGKSLQNIAVSENYSYIYNFLNLLEKAFQIQDQQTTLSIKTATEFADQLNVHPNYLNTLVKKQTGKTLRDHIQDRMLYEAKSLLLQTNWDIQAIAYVLGFSDQAAFSSFFRKKASIPPSQFRKNTFAQDHL